MNGSNKLVGQSSLIFVSMTEAHLSKAPLRFYTLGLAPGLTHKYWTKQERPAKNKHNILFAPVFGYEENRLF
jgi:hypothetical protein